MFVHPLKIARNAKPMVLGSMVLVLGLFLGTSGCRQEAAGPPPSATAKSVRYAITGEVLDVVLDRGRLIVKHEPIPGYMPAMTMEFVVSAGDLANARKGQRITAEMVSSPDGDFLLERIWPADPVAVTTVESGAKSIVEETRVRGRNAYREVGETAPVFALYRQDGEVVTAGRYRGKQVMVNFIFSRCPVATMCPAAVARFQQVQQKARAAGVSNLELVSITLDPTFDTPGVLREYANARMIDTSNYSFLTGPEKAIKALLAQFGVLADFSGDLLNHTLATVLVDETGRIAWRADGSTWSAEEFVSRMKH